MGPRAAAQNWQKKVQEMMATLSIGKASSVLFCHPQRSLKCLLHGDDFVVLGEPVDLVWMRNELESKLEINTTILGYEPGMPKEVKILNRKLCWHDGVGISCEADQKHTETIIRETGASNLTSLKIPMSKESMGEVRDKTDDIVEKRKLGKLGMKEQPLIGNILSPAKTTRKSALATAKFLAIDRGKIVLKRTQIRIGQVAEERAAAPQEDTQLQDLFSSKCGAKHKPLWLSVQRKPNCTA